MVVIENRRRLTVRAQSIRIAVTGLTRAARKAGIQLAPMATAASARPTAANVIGSRGSTWKSIDRIHRVEAMAPAEAASDDGSNVHGIQVVRSTASMAAAMRRQVSVSVPSRRRPAAVSL